MAIPNMAMIPSGYKPTKLYSVLPTPSYGSEEVTNGDFATDSDWTKGTGWTISGGKASCDGTQTSTSYCSQTLSVTSGDTLRLTIDVVVDSGTFTILDGTSGTIVLSETESGSYSVVFDWSGSNGNLLLRAPNGFIGSVDNISVKEVLVSDADFDVSRASSATRVNAQGLIETPEFIVSDDLISNGDFSDGSTGWNLGSGITIGGGVALFSSVPSGLQLSKNGTEGVVGKEYKITYEIKSITEGGFSVSIGTTLSNIESNQVGVYTEYLTATGTGIFYIRSRGTTSGSVDNISVVQVEREDIPRLDYTDGGCPVLLTEPQSTNLVTNSNDMLASSWGQTTATVTLSSNLNPSGDSVCYRVERIGSGQQLGGVANGATIGQTYTSSVYLRRISGSGIVSMRDVNNVSTQVTITDEWQRYSVTGVANSASGRYYYVLGSDGDVIEVSFAQLEPLLYATSYIPTYGAISTRASETINNAGDVNTFNSTEGVLFAEIAALSDDLTVRQISLTDGTTSNYVRIEYSNASNRLIFSTSVATFMQTFTYDITDTLKLGFKYKENDFAMWVNGVEVATDNLGGVFPTDTLTTLQFDGGNGGNAFYGKTSQVQVFNTALSDQELKLLTGGEDNYDSYEAMRIALNYNIQ